MNTYEQACQRFERISRDRQHIQEAARQVIDWADNEYEAAQENLRHYEQAPGIPLPEYQAAGGESGTEES